MSEIYLDHAAATPVDPRVVKAMAPFASLHYANPSSIHRAGRKAKASLAEARQTIARVLHCQPAEIIFTAGATEANNLAIRGVMEKNPEGEILVSAVEHESVLAPAGLFSARRIPVNREGITEQAEISKIIN